MFLYTSSLFKPYEPNAPRFQPILQISDLRIWVSNSATNTSVMALVATNTGGEPGIIEAITVKGISIPYSSWYYHQVESSTVAQNPKVLLKPDFSPEFVDIDSSTPSEEPLIRATGPVPLKNLESVIIYLKNPANMGSDEADITVSVTTRISGVTQTFSTPVVNTN